MAKNYKFETLLEEGFENATQHFYDEDVEENAEFRASSGIKAIIKRVMVGETCQWCEDLAGVYEYGKHPSDIFRRHRNCDCIVEHITEKERTNVHTKNKTQNNRFKRIEFNRYAKEIEDFGTIKLKTPSYGEKAIRPSTRLQLSDEIKEILDTISKNGEYMVLDRNVTDEEMTILTAERGQEFTKLKLNGKTILVHGDETETMFTMDFYTYLLENGAYLDSHTHPYIGDVTPSPNDYNVFTDFKIFTNQEKTKLISVDGQITYYNEDTEIGHAVVEKDGTHDQKIKEYEMLFEGLLKDKK